MQRGVDLGLVVHSLSEDIKKLMILVTLKYRNTPQHNKFLCGKGNAMITMLSASTCEVDDLSVAVEEIFDQIDEAELKANSFGIISCNLEFILNGTTKALCEQLPFDVFGGTTAISDICGEADEYQLSLMILTSDDVFFASGVSDSLGENGDKKITELHDAVAKKLNGEAVFGIFFAPFLLEVGADAQLRALDKASGGIPLFGTIALDYINDIRDPRTIYNGIDHTDKMALLLISGNVDPKFFLESISEERFLKQKAIITSSDGSVLKEVNKMPAIKYLESIGLAVDGAILSIPLLPLSIDIGDGGCPVARAIFAVTPEGYVICGGDMPEGATLGVGSLDGDDVEATATKLATKVVEAKSKNAALIFSCMGRNRALGLDPMHEISKIQAVLGNKIPYLFMYSSGELYPDIVDGKPLNKAHNDSIIACVL